MKLVNKTDAFGCKNANAILMLAYRTVNPHAPADPATRCRFDMFVRIAPGIASTYKDQKRSWCYRGDKYTDEPPRMLRNLLNLLKKNDGKFDRVILYDNHATADTREIVRIIDGVLEVNRINRYAMMLHNYQLPAYLKPSTL